jgi:hypothetical protein
MPTTEVHTAKARAVVSQAWTAFTSWLFPRTTQDLRAQSSGSWPTSAQRGEGTEPRTALTPWLLKRPLSTNSLPLRISLGWSMWFGCVIWWSGWGCLRAVVQSVGGGVWTMAFCVFPHLQGRGKKRCVSLPLLRARRGRGTDSIKSQRRQAHKA